MLQYYSIDTETTGFSAKIHEVTEISIVRFSDRNQLTKFIKAEFPERASPEALQITGKTFQDLLNGEAKEMVVQAVYDFLLKDGLTEEHRVMVAHNALFDVRFVHALFDKCGKKFPATNWLCTKSLARDWAKKLGLVKPKLTLEASLIFTNCARTAGQHTAKIDSQNCYRLLKHGMDSGIDHLPHIKRYPHEE